MIYTLYKVTFPNQKIYVGITSRSLDLRKKEHKYHWKKTTSFFHKALDKYKNQEIWEIIYQTKVKLDIFEKEKYFIQLFQSNIKNKGYNLTSGGEGILNYQFSEDQNQTNSQNKKEFLKNNPDILNKQLINLQKFRNENPKFNQEKAIKQFESSEYRQWFGQKMKESYIKNGFKGGKKRVSIKLIQNNNELIFHSISEAARFLNCTKSAISNVIHGRSKSVRGYNVIRIN